MNEIEKRAKANKELGEVSKKIDVEDRREKRMKEYLKGDIEHGRDTTKSRIDLKYSSRNKERLEKERQRILDKMK